MSEEPLTQPGEKRPRQSLMGDSVWCGGAACVLLIVGDLGAVAWGGRHQMPAQIFVLTIAGILLAFLNVYFIYKDQRERRHQAAALGLVLSLVAMFIAFDPPWASLVQTGAVQPPTTITPRT